MLNRPYKRPITVVLLGVFFIMVPAFAGNYASIIIDDLGNNLEHGKIAIDLPGSITLAFLPHTDFASVLADRAHHSGKEIILHLPLQSVRH
jgi:polysaccharide deacetylase 2 family uncharacterized protein YibQ